MLTADKWKDYALIDMARGEKLEDWGGIYVIRPDPQIVWDKPGFKPAEKRWEEAHMRYIRSKSGGGGWEFFKRVPDKWEIGYGNLRFVIRPTDFKHMGLFPEQAVNWDWIAPLIANRVSEGKPARILNIFAYTGGATVAAAKAGAVVTHVDSSKGATAWAKQNAAVSGVGEKNLRFITEDAVKFVNRELRRKNGYEAVIMDPPKYGRGADGELWKIEDKLFELVKSCAALLSDSPLFFLINSYSGFSAAVLQNILEIIFPGKSRGIECGELGLKCENGLLLPCGIYGRLLT